MTTSEEILKELQEISPAIAQIDRKNVYSVPLNYFDGLAGNIMQFVKDDIAGPALGHTGNPYAVPAGYFDNLAGFVMDKIKQQESFSEVDVEISAIALSLKGINKSMPYTVPAGYFNNLTSKLVKGLGDDKPQAKVVTTGWFKRSYKYAAAATIAAAVLVSTFVWGPQLNTDPSREGLFSTTIDIPAAVDKVSEEEIIDYLSDNSFGPEVGTPLNSLNVEVDIEQFIENATEEEIKEYLKAFDEPLSKKAKDI